VPIGPFWPVFLAEPERPYRHPSRWTSGKDQHFSSGFKLPGLPWIILALYGKKIQINLSKLLLSMESN